MISWLYGKIVNYRNALYEKGTFKTFSLEVPTISVGNITVGGTGKTPLVAFIVEVLAEHGEKVCVLTRGYGRENAKQRALVSDGKEVLANPKEAGDEPFELAHKLLGKSMVIADANRVAAGNWARENFGITAFVLDDAFQHRKVERDLDIVLLDASNPFGNSKVLPAGILRESLENLNRANAIIITRANLADNLEDLKMQISNITPNCPIFVSKNEVANLVNLIEFPAKTQTAKTKNQIITDKALAFCGLGNANNFFEQLRREKFDLISTETFPDHHFYTSKDIAGIEKTASEKNAEVLLTTAKDAVKLKNFNFNLPCFVVESELVFDNETGFRKLVLAKVEK